MPRPWLVVSLWPRQAGIKALRRQHAAHGKRAFERLSPDSQAI
ncbi:hypothetical protein [Pontibacter sp. E15-1]|nr:hypothetical protein [Pontibacter sp. E15-1]